MTKIHITTNARLVSKSNLKKATEGNFLVLTPPLHNREVEHCKAYIKYINIKVK